MAQCEGCNEEFNEGELDDDGLCVECADEYADADANDANDENDEGGEESV